MAISKHHSRKALYKLDKQQESIVWPGALYSVFCNNLYGKRI